MKIENASTNNPTIKEKCMINLFNLNQSNQYYELFLNRNTNKLIIRSFNITSHLI